VITSNPSIFLIDPSAGCLAILFMVENPRFNSFFIKTTVILTNYEQFKELIKKKFIYDII